MFVFHKIELKKKLGHYLLADKREISAYLNIALSKLSHYRPGKALRAPGVLSL